MKLTKKQKQNKKNKAAQKRKIEEAAMAQYLIDKGWEQSGIMGDVWKIDSWKSFQENPCVREGYRMQPNPEGSGDLITKVWDATSNQKKRGEKTIMSLRKAYKVQRNLDATGFEKPKSLDDDLADLL